MLKVEAYTGGGVHSMDDGGANISCMCPKPLEPLAKRLMKGVIVLELLGVFGAYAYFRHTMNRRFPSILEVYYQSNEWAGVYGIRERDHQAWASKRD
ncbi:hypothetical protein INR49_020553 [Caranx melampygus]|nr:hypothetical protein INR49_020553 [Caranx melampygus]